MTDDRNSITDEQIDIFLDGLLEPAERKIFEQRLRDCPEAAEEAAQLARIDASLQRLFPPQQVPEHQLEQTLAMPRVTPQVSIGRARRVAVVSLAAGSLAAGLAWLLVVWQLGDHPNETPFFEPRPVALVYQEVVDNGFEPYYECREADRFSATFLRRQQQALQLAALPTGSRMLGLSYAGGLTRNTTAMLCQVDDQPVMVFVDRLERDQPIAAQLEAGNLQVHRVARDGLVFYEVTPFATSRVIEFLLSADSN